MEDALISVASLHALVYCPRLFYLEEVERIRLADSRVFAGRRLHVELAEDGPVERTSFTSAELGIMGTVDVVRRRDGRTVPYEHKRGRSAGSRTRREAWRTDRIQIAAYAMLMEEAVRAPINEGRIRYHGDGVTVVVPIDAGLRAEVSETIASAKRLQLSVERPPIAENERLCERCSLAPACLPEEERAAASVHRPVLRLFPEHRRGQTVHVAESDARVGRTGDSLIVRRLDETVARFPIVDVDQVVIHALAQISTQAIRLCAERGIGVHWVTYGGQLTASLAPSAATAQRHIRQFAALADGALLRLNLARRLVVAKLEAQLRFVLRASRGAERTPAVQEACAALRQGLRGAARAADADELLGCEGSGASAYFGALPDLLDKEIDPRLRPHGRSRRPPMDEFNALLSYGYGALYREVLGAVVAVGLHPGVGFYHRPRSAAHALALDLMELFRVPVVDMAVVAAVNRRSFDPDQDFARVNGGVLLTESGRAKCIEVIERRKQDVWKHSVVGYSLSYARMMELETRLLEKEWTGAPGMFARFRLR